MPSLEPPPEQPLWEQPPFAEDTARGPEQLRSAAPPPGLPSGSNRVFSCVSHPTYCLHRPAQPNGVGLVICPGGGFRDVWLDREGHDLALRLKVAGITSLVLKYRTRPSDLSRPNAWQHYQCAVRADARQAIRLLRQQADPMGLDPDKMGICGFSAGGHLAISTSLYPGDEVADTVSGMPNFAGLFYPGIPEGWEQLLRARVSSKSGRDEICPMFIINARADTITPAKRCLAFYQALLEAGINAELHVFAKGNHGFDLGEGRGESMTLWPDSFVAWLKDIRRISE